MVDRLKDESGYSLVEVVVAIMLLGLAIIPMVGMFDAGLRAAVLGGNYDQARALASEELAEIQALPFASPDPAASGTNNSVIEIYPPQTSPRACTESASDPIDPMFNCRVETTYVRLSDSGVDPVPDTSTMVLVEVTVAWDNTSYSTTGLVVEGTL